MKKFLALLLTLSLGISSLPAMAVGSEDVALLPSQARRLTEEFEAGDYGEEVFQILADGYFISADYIFTFYRRDGEPGYSYMREDEFGEFRGSDFDWETRAFLPEWSPITEEKYQAIKDYVSQTGFDSLPDYSGNYAENCNFCYTHVTSGGTSYVQMTNADINGLTVYEQLIKLMLGSTPYLRTNELSVQHAADTTEPVLKAFRDGDYGDADELYYFNTRPVWQSAGGRTVIVAVKDGRAYLSSVGGTELAADDYERLTGFIELYDYDNLPWFPNPGVYDGSRDCYIHITANDPDALDVETKFVQAVNADMSITRMLAGGQEIYGYEPQLSGGSVYARMRELMYSFQGTGTGNGTLPSEGRTNHNLKTIRFNGEATMLFCREKKGIQQIEFKPALLNKVMGIHRIWRPDVDTVILNRGTKLLLFDRGHNYATEIETAGRSDPAALAEALLSPDAYENGIAKLTPIGASVISDYLPLDAICHAFGMEYEITGTNGCFVDITAPEAENLDDDYVNRLVGLLMSNI